MKYNCYESNVCPSKSVLIYIYFNLVYNYNIKIKLLTFQIISLIVVKVLLAYIPELVMPNYWLVTQRMNMR